MLVSDLDRGERQVLAGVRGAVERPGRRVRVRLGLAGAVRGRGVDGAEPGERAEPAQGHDHRPALGRAVGAVLGAHVEHLGLAVGRQRRPAGDGLGLRADLAAAVPDLVERAGRHARDVGHHAGQGRAGGAVRRAGRRRLAVRLDHDEGHHDRHHGDDAARRDEDPPALLGAAFGRALGGDPLPAAGCRPSSCLPCPCSLRPTLASASWRSGRMPAGSMPAPTRRSSPSSRVPGSMLGAPPYRRAHARRLCGKHCGVLQLGPGGGHARGTGGSARSGALFARGGAERDK